MARATFQRLATRAAVLRAPLLALSSLALSGFVNVCSSSTPTAPASTGIDPAVVDGYRLFANGDCAEVGRKARAPDVSPSDRARGAYLRLLGAYCVELGGDLRAARELYSSIASDSAPETPGFEAALRLRELARLESTGMTRVRLKELILEERRKSPHEVRPLHRAEPTYPKTVIEAGIEGFVMVGYGIEGDGTVTDVVVLESDPPFVFDGAALEAVRSWTYERSAAEAPIRNVVKLQFQIDAPNG